jgi:prolycopene isomerase
MKEKYDAIIIGGGVAGLSTGAWLAYKGLDVIVLEQREKPGGLCVTFERAGTFYNPGATMLTGYGEGSTLRKFARTLDLEKEMELISLRCGFKTVLPEHTVSLWSDKEKTIADLCQMFPAESQKIHELFITMQKIYDEVNSISFLGTGLIDFFKVPLKCPHMLAVANKTVSQFMNKYFSNQKLQAALTGVLPAFMGPPSRVAVIPYIMLMMGLIGQPVYTIKGGIFKLPEALAKGLAKHGGELNTNSQVVKIILENNQAQGVELANGDRIQGRYVISASDATNTFIKLVGENSLKPDFIKRIKTTPTSSSLVVSYMSLDMDLLANGYEAAHHLISHTYDYNELYNDFEANMLSETEYNHSLNLASISDPSLAPPGFSTLEIQLNVPYTPKDGWSTLKEIMAEKLIKRAQKLIPDIEDHLVVQEVSTPLSFEKITGSRYGAVGWAPYPEYTGLKALHHATPVKNLYLAGQWTEPGESLAACMLSGLQVSKMILDREGLKNSINELI